MVGVGCQLRFFSHVGDGAPDVPLRRVTPFCFITNFCRRAVSGNIASIFLQSAKHCTNIARMSRQQSRDVVFLQSRNCVVPYDPEFTANSKHRRTMFAPTSHSGKFLPPQNRSALCGFYSVLEDSKAVQSSPLRLNLYIKIKLEILLSPLCTAW